MIDPNTIDFAKGDGLVPVVVQDAATLQVLTLAYMDRAALDETLAGVREAGGVITVEPFDFPGGRRFHFRDTEGNELAVWSEG